MVLMSNNGKTAGDEEPEPGEYALSDLDGRTSVVCRSRRPQSRVDHVRSR